MRVSPHWFAVGLALAGQWAVAAEKTAVPFRAISFDEAGQAAAAEKKLVFIDFFTTWCLPCRALDDTTWQDGAVGKLLRQKTVPLKIDAEKELALAARYNVTAYPTLLLLKPDGTEIERLLGYRDPATFVQEFNFALAGKTEAIRAAEAEVAEKSAAAAAMARYKLGQTLAADGKEKQALREFLWCYDVGMVHLRSLRLARAATVPRAVAALGRDYPPALVALRERRDRAERRMDADTRAQSRSTELLAQTDASSAAEDFSYLNEVLKENERTLAAFDRLSPDDPRRPILSTWLRDLFASAQRYDDAAKAMPYDLMLRQFDRDQEQMKQRETRTSAINRPFRHDFAARTAMHVEVLVGSGQLEAARALSAKMLEVENSAETMRLLQNAGKRGGHPELWPESAPTLH